MQHVNELKDNKTDLEKLEELHEILSKSHQKFLVWFDDIKKSLNPELLELINSERNNANI